MKKNRNAISLVVAAFAAALFAALALTVIQASVVRVGIESETGNLEDGALEFSDNDASGDKYVSFEQAQNVTDPVSRADINALIDPDDQFSTPRSAKDQGQIVVAGEFFNTESSNGRNGPALNAVGQTPNTSIANGQVHGPAMLDGETLRFGVVDDQTCSGQRALQFAVQWTDNSLYRGYDTGVPHPYTNNQTGRPNDQLFYDGSRVQMSYLAEPQRISRGDTIWQTFSVRMGDWVYASDNKVLNQYHSPDNLGTGLSPFLAWYLQNGTLRVIGRTHSGNRPTNQNMRPVFTQEIPQATTQENHDKWQDWIVTFKRDPYSSSAFVKVWLRIAGGQWEQVVNYNGPFGLDYSGYSGGRTDYLVSSYYQWHLFSDPNRSGANPTDTNYPVRRMWWRWNSLINKQANKYSLQDMKDHIAANTSVCR